MSSQESQMLSNYYCNHTNGSETYRQGHSGSECIQYDCSNSSACMYPGNNPGYSPNIIKNKVPPEVPKRTSSISFRSLQENQQNIAVDTGSLSSVQSSGSDGSFTSHNLNQTNSSVESSVLSNSIMSWNTKSQVFKCIQH